MNDIKISKLSEPKDWTLWKMQVKVVLRSMEVFGVVDNSEKEPVLKANPTTTETTDFNTAHAAWVKKDLKAQSVILTSIEKQPSTHIVNCKTASEMWNKLLVVFEQRSSTSIDLLYEKFFALTKEPTDDMASFISKMEEIAQHLNDLGEKIPERMVMTRIVKKLPSMYNHFHSAWESTSEEKKTLIELRNRLMTEEKRLESNDETADSAFFATNAGIRKRSKESNLKKVRRCFICGDSTHLKKDCVRRNKTKDNSSNALVCEALVSVSESDAWYNDSGATEHMSNRFEWFYDYTPLAEHRPVKLGNGQYVYGVGVGKINVEVFDGNKWSEKHLSEVLFVPKLHMNLFSQGSCCDKGYEYVANSNECRFQRDGNVIAMGVRQSTLYKMLIKVKAASVACASVVVSGESIQVWHERLAHQHVAHVRRFLKRNGIDFIDDPNFQCVSCVLGKHHRLPFKGRNQTTNKCGELIHTDLCGPFEVNSLGGARYMLVLKDDYSHMRFLYFLKAKSEVSSKIKTFVELVHNQTEHKILRFRSDQGTEFNNIELKTFFAEKGIVYQRTVAYTPEQNGSVERENRTIVEALRTMLHARSLNKMLWAEAANTAVYVINRTGTSSVPNKTPCEMWFGKQLDFGNFKSFGSVVYVHIPKQKRHKLDEKAEKCLFVGYGENIKGYRVYNPSKRTVTTVHDIIFDKNDSKNNNTDKNVCENNIEENDNEVIVRLGFDEEEEILRLSNAINETSIDESDLTVINIDSSYEEGDTSYSSADSSVNESQAEDVPVSSNNFCDVQRSNVVDSRTRSGANIASCAFLASTSEPTTYNEAVNDERSKEWVQAMNEEYDSLIKNRTWEMTNLPKGQRAVDNRWVFRIKRNQNNAVDRYKARLVARGFTQCYGIDYTETFSPVVKFASVRTLLAIAAERGMFMKQFDVKTAFLYGDLTEEVYMRQPIGFEDGTNRVCRLTKSLYGLKQAPRCWNAKFKKFITDFEFKESEADACVYIRKSGNDTTYLAIFVDDGIIISTSESCIQPVIGYLQTHFEIKVFNANYFLGLEINRMSDGSIHLSQPSYTNRVLNKFGFEDSHPVATPVNHQQVLEAAEEASNVKFPYRQVVGSLIYLAIGTRPDISFAVGYVSRFMEQPTNAHVTAVKRILKYLKGTSNYGILFSSENANNLKFSIYSDADYAGCTETRRSTTGYCLLLGKGIVSWCSERQSSVSHSTAESEYIAASLASRELIWLKRLLGEVDETTVSNLPTLFVDNESAVKIIKNTVLHKRTKHIEVKYHSIRENVAQNVFSVKGICTEKQLADIFTKPLPKIRFERICVHS